MEVGRPPQTARKQLCCDVSSSGKSSGFIEDNLLLGRGLGKVYTKPGAAASTAICCMIEKNRSELPSLSPLPPTPLPAGNSVLHPGNSLSGLSYCLGLN